MPIAAIDNDILLKGACYGLLDELVAAIPTAPNDSGVLGAARFVIRSRIAAATLSRDQKEIMAMLETFLGKAVVLEPNLDETKFAAEIEFVAQRNNLALDSGESQLCAIVISRMIPWLITGDKRAIRALEKMLEYLPALAKLTGKLICLEQLIARGTSSLGAAKIRDAICKEPAVDRALSICFECSNSHSHPDSWLQGLQSYIGDLRKNAERILVA